jgi:hypothetical protein
MKRKLIKEYFIDYVNGFATMSGFADYYGLNEDVAKRIISIGMKLWNRDIKPLKG